MVTKIQDDNGFIIGYCEWRQVGQSGFDKLRGEYIWVNDIWVHEDYESKGFINEMISMILSKAVEAKFCYFKREKYHGRLSKLWKRESFERLTQKEYSMKGIL